jgi:fructose-1,6-bisphosphatase/sedoheptulose 1,7-bisphosphatase-like protein
MSNLGALRNRQLRESVILAAGLSSIGVGLHGRGSFAALPKNKATKEAKNDFKRANDRTAAQIMAEVLHTTANKLPVGEEVLIASTITEGVRVKPGKEAGGNPTIAVGALFGKRDHRALYGLPMTNNVTLLSMGSDVIDGTTKSVMGAHSSFTALFLTESGVKRHLPDIYVQRWMAGAYFEEFNPREHDLLPAAEIIAQAYGKKTIEGMSSFFLDRKRHHLAMDILNKAGVSTPYDSDGDLFPALIMGYDNISFPDGHRFDAMIGEIGGSAEWAVGVLPLVWRGGQAIGMLTSQDALTRNDLTFEEKWNKRFQFTEEEFMLLQDARFEQKPYFSIRDILEEPFAGGISAFGAITDNYYLPFMKGAGVDSSDNTLRTDVLAVNSLGIMEIWHMIFKCHQNIETTKSMMMSPKMGLMNLSGSDLKKAVKERIDDDDQRRRFRLFFNNEYYPALIPVRDKLVLLPKAIDTLIGRGALSQKDREIINVTRETIGRWFYNND